MFFKVEENNTTFYSKVINNAKNPQFESDSLKVTTIK